MGFRCFSGFFRAQLVHLFSLGVFVQIFVTVTSTTSLYSPDDPLWELDISNFDRHVYGKKNQAWIIEFYSSWCGHCIKFAPTWKAFAKDIQTWKNVIDVAVVNCADSQNLKLCRRYEVESYPTIKLFWVDVDESEMGTKLSAGDRKIDAMRHFIIKFLESHWSNGAPENWPILEPLESKDLDELWSDVPGKSVILIVEGADSFLGREVILDMSSKPGNIKPHNIRRVLRDSELLDNMKSFRNSSEIVLLKLEKDGDEEILYSFANDTDDTFVRDKIFKILTGHPRSTYSEKLSPDKPSESHGSVDYRGVYMVDLENGLRYTLRNEIGVHQHITGQKLMALKAFLSALKMYFPGSPSVMSYLSKLHRWSSHHRTNITGEMFLDALDKIETEKEFIPEMQEWIGCKGSSPRYRGYPCSLWTLLHALTVRAYNVYEEDPLYMKEDPRKVLHTIRDYIKYFFTCEECSRHFQIMAANLEKEVHNPQDTVLWLWSAHNKVNQRLAGDDTEDPEYPKLQFPPAGLCSKCQTVVQNASQYNIQWDTSAVLRFLLHMYGRQNIIKDDGDHGVNSEGNKMANNSLNAQNSNTIRIRDRKRGKRSRRRKKPTCC